MAFGSNAGATARAAMTGWTACWNCSRRRTRAQRLDWLLITGDITDAARNAEFVAFEDAVARHPTLRDRILIIPGNHDVNIVDRANPSRLELPIAPGGPLRRLRFLSTMARLQGGRVRVVDHATKRVGPTLDAWLAQDGRARRWRASWMRAGCAPGWRRARAGTRRFR